MAIRNFISVQTQSVETKMYDDDQERRLRKVKGVLGKSGAHGGSGRPLLINAACIDTNIDAILTRK